MKKIAVIPLLTVCLSVVCGLLSCDADDRIDSPPQLVVEGWIDDGEFPVVMLTTTVPVTSEYQDMSSLEQYMIKWAKVTVSDGETEVVLTGKVNKNYYPPYIYTTGRLQGKAGKRYRLTVEYEDYYAEAETTIPEPLPIDSFLVTPVGNDSLCQLTACFRDDPTKQDYYAFFTYKWNEPLPFYKLASQAVFSDEVTGSELHVPLYNSRSLTEHGTDYSIYNRWGDVVRVKFVRMDAASFRFWQSYEEIRQLSRNPLFPVTENMASNINGGLGYWCGYGACYYQAPLDKEGRVLVYR